MNPRHDVHLIVPKAPLNPGLLSRFTRVFLAVVARQEWRGPQLNVNDPRLMMWWPSAGVDGVVQPHIGTGGISPAYNAEWAGFFARTNMEDDDNVPRRRQTMEEAITQIRAYYPVGGPQ